MLLRGEVQDPPHNFQPSVGDAKDSKSKEENNVCEAIDIPNIIETEAKHFREDDIFEFVNIHSAEKIKKINSTSMINDSNNENNTKEREQEYGTFACENLLSPPSFYQSTQRMGTVQNESKIQIEDNSTYNPYVMSGSHQKLINAMEVQQEKVRTWLDREKERTARTSQMYGSDMTPVRDRREKRDRELTPEQFRSGLKINPIDISRYTDSGTPGSPTRIHTNPSVHSSSSSSVSFSLLEADGTTTAPCPSFSAQHFIAQSATSNTAMATTAHLPSEQFQGQGQGQGQGLGQGQGQGQGMTQITRHTQGMTSPQRAQNTTHTTVTSPTSCFPSSLDISAMGSSTIGRTGGYNSHTNSASYGVTWSEQQYALSDRAIMAALAKKQADIEKNERSNKDNCNNSYSDVSTYRGGYSMNTSRYNHSCSYQPSQPEELIFDLRESMISLHINQTTTVRQNMYQNTQYPKNIATSFTSHAVGPGDRNLDLNTRPRNVPSSSLYFRSQIANFGMTAVGCNSRQKLELCNSSSEEVRTCITY